MREIGGYFELHLEQANRLPYEGLYFNSGRSALEYVLSCRKPRYVYLPEYICSSIVPAIKRSGAKLCWYRVDEQLYPLIDPDIFSNKKVSVILVNYFGVRSDLLSKYRCFRSSIIWDMSQAFYCPLPAANTGFYSPRKFFGIPDGGILVDHEVTRASYDRLDASNAHDKMAHLVKRIDCGAAPGYYDFKVSNKLLSKEGMRRVSNVSLALLRSIDYAKAAHIRSKNYRFLHKYLHKINSLKLPGACLAPMAYPLKLDRGCLNLRNYLIQKQVYIPKYWPDCKTDVSRELADSILALPLDQRYGSEEMGRIIKLIGGYLGNKNIFQGS